MSCALQTSRTGGVLEAVPSAAVMVPTKMTFYSCHPQNTGVS